MYPPSQIIGGIHIAIHLLESDKVVLLHHKQKWICENKFLLCRWNQLLCLHGPLIDQYVYMSSNSFSILFLVLCYLIFCLFMLQFIVYVFVLFCFFCCCCCCFQFPWYFMEKSLSRAHSYLQATRANDLYFCFIFVSDNCTSLSEYWREHTQLVLP